MLRTSRRLSPSRGWIKVPQTILVVNEEEGSRLDRRRKMDVCPRSDGLPAIVNIIKDSYIHGFLFLSNKSDLQRQFVKRISRPWYFSVSSLWG